MREVFSCDLGEDQSLLVTPLEVDTIVRVTEWVDGKEIQRSEQVISPKTYLAVGPEIEACRIYSDKMCRIVHRNHNGLKP